MIWSPRSKNTDYHGESIGVAFMEAGFRKDKIKAKSNFTQSRNSLLFKVKYQNVTSCSEVLDACQKMDMCMERVIELLSNLTSFYIENKDLDRSKMVIDEMEKIETEFHLAYEIAWAYLDSWESVKSSSLFQNRSIVEDKGSEVEEGRETDTCYKTDMQNASVSTLDTVRTFDQTNKDKLIRNTAGSFASTDDMATPNIGHDMWTQLKRVEIPVFW